MKKLAFFLLLAMFGLSFSAFAQINVDSVRIDSVKYASSTARFVYVRVFGLLVLPANVSIYKGVCPSYNSLGVTPFTAITVIGNSSYVIAVNGLPVDSCIKLQAVVGGGNAAAFSSVFTFTNSAVHPCSFTPSIVASADSSCAGDSILLIATPAGAQYQWRENGINISTSQMLNVSNTATYRVLITKSGCTDSIEKQLKFLPSPKINGYVISGSTMVISGHFMMPFTITVNNINYIPVYSDSTQIILNGVTGIHTCDLIHVEYTETGCFDDMMLVFTSIEELNHSVEKELTDLRIYNLQGQEVRQPLSPGIYIQGKRKIFVPIQR